MKKPFNRLQAMIIKAMAEALFHNRTMAISADQVVDNLQEHFSNIEGNKPVEIGMALCGLLLVLGGPFFLLAPPGIRKNLIRRRLQKSPRASSSPAIMVTGSMATKKRISTIPSMPISISNCRRSATALPRENVRSAANRSVISRQECSLVMVPSRRKPT